MDKETRKNEDLFYLECYCLLKKYKEAIKYIDKIILNKSEHLEEAIVLLAGKLNENKNAKDLASQMIRKGLSLFPSNLELKMELCRNLFQQGIKKEAFDLCQLLINENPLIKGLWYLQSELFHDCGDYEKAIDSINYAISCILDEKEDEEKTELLYLTAIVKAQYLFKNGSYYLAIRCLEELISNKLYEKAVIDYYLADCYLYLSDFDKAFELLNGIIGLKEVEDETALYGNLIYCCLQTDRQQIAVDLLTDGLIRFPDKLLNHLTALYSIKNYHQETDFSNRKLVNSFELVRNYFVNNLVNN
jgi:tetratricopeptide (TPR) repeat protein